MSIPLGSPKPALSPSSLPPLKLDEPSKISLSTSLPEKVQQTIATTSLSSKNAILSNKVSAPQPSSSSSPSSISDADGFVEVQPHSQSYKNEEDSLVEFPNLPLSLNPSDSIDAMCQDEEETGDTTDGGINASTSQPPKEEKDSVPIKDLKILIPKGKALPPQGKK